MVLLLCGMTPIYDPSKESFFEKLEPILGPRTRPPSLFAVRFRRFTENGEMEMRLKAARTGFRIAYEAKAGWIQEAF